MFEVSGQLRESTRRTKRGTVRALKCVRRKETKMFGQVPPMFERFKKRAAELIKHPGNVLDELARADSKANTESNAIKKFVEDLKLLIRMVRAWAKREYKETPVLTIILAVAGIMYFVSPLDFIPDFIAGMGYIDDASVIAFVIMSIKNDLDAFKQWELKRGGAA